MKQSIYWISIILIAGLLFLGCSSSDDSNVSSGSDSGTETSFNFTMTSYKSQETASSSAGAQADFTADQIMTGQLTATPSGGGTAQVFDWSIYFDETTFDVQSNKTIILAPGTYDFSLLITKGSQEYAGNAAGVSISDGTFDVPMTVSPVIGDTVTDVTLVASLADFKFQYDPAELSAASLSNPQMGIIVDGGAEAVFTINPTTGISDNYVNLPEGSHTVQLKLYDASLQVGRSITAQESVIITAGLDLAMDLVALHGETTFALTEAGGDAYFDFNIPAEVVDEAGGLANLEVLFSIVGPNNPLEEQTLTLVPDGSGGYEADITLTNKQFDEVDISLAFTDTSVPELLGSCTMEATLDTTQRTLNCDVTLRRRAIIGGSLLATLGINVMNECGEPVAGASVFKDGALVGVTNSGTFGTEGYLKVYLNPGDYTISAEDSSLTGQEDVSLSPLTITNIDITLHGPVAVLPDTGQTNSFTDVFGEDSDYIISPQSYTDNSDGTISDNNTLLIWQKTDDNINRSLNDADLYCENLVLGGATDWRLPTVKELQSIVDYGQYQPAINSSYFQNTLNARYWTSDDFPDDPTYSMVVYFSYGDVNRALKNDSSTYTRCVRGGVESNVWALDFTVAGDGTVVQTATGLVWQEVDDNTTRTWEDSIAYCEGLTLAGANDWRLPNFTELMSIIDYSTDRSSQFHPVFPDTDSSYFWSSTYIQNYNSLAWYHLSDGRIANSNPNNAYYSRCVRGGL